MVLLCGNRPEFASTYAATHRRGLRLTAVNWHLTAEETAYIAADCGAKAIVADVELADVATAVAATTPLLTTRIAAGGAIDGFDPWDDALGAYDGSNIADPVLGSSMLYTSGTTGRPKGVFRKKAVPPLAAAQAVYDYRDGDRHLCTGPLYHAAPLAFSLAIPLMNGIGVTLMTHWTAEDSLRLVEADRITHTHMVPTMFHRMLVAARRRARPLRRVDAALRAARRGAVPGRGEAADDGVARARWCTSTTARPRAWARGSTARRGSSTRAASVRR